MKCDICGGTVAKENVVISWSDHNGESGTTSLDDIHLSHKACYDRVPGEFDKMIQCDTKKSESKTPTDVVEHLIDTYKTRSGNAELKLGQIIRFTLDLEAPRRCID